MEKSEETQHQVLRNTYSKILREKLDSNQILSQVPENIREKIFQELTKWFGTSPPSTNKVKSEFKSIIENDISVKDVNIE